MALKENRNQGTMVKHDEKLQHSHLHRCTHFPSDERSLSLLLQLGIAAPGLRCSAKMYAKLPGHAHRLSMTMWSL